jgi:regulatory protein
LATLCAQAEHCEQEMRDKMKRWEIDETVQNRIIDRLVKERYIDNERYARAFVKDKIRYNKWGRRKVQQALWMKRIDNDIQQRVLDEIDDKEYLDVLRPLLKQKRKSTKAANDHELNQKLVRFALGRGFTFDIIRQCLEVDEEMDYGDETD